MWQGGEGNTGEVLKRPTESVDVVGTARQLAEPGSSVLAHGRPRIKIAYVSSIDHIKIAYVSSIDHTRARPRERGAGEMQH
jgi:hypothetical protein